MNHDGTDLPKSSSPVLAVIRVQVDLTQDEASSMVLKARLVAGIHYLAQQFEEADLREVGAGTWNLSLTGANGPDLARKSFDAAKMLRERMLVDLALPSRIALHAAVTGDEESLREQALSLCERLQAQAPENAIAVSPDVYRVLEEDVRPQLSPPAHLDGDELQAAQFPPRASSYGKDLWEELLRDLTRPAVRRLHYVGFRLQKKEPPSLDIFDVFVMPAIEARRNSTPPVEALAEFSPLLPCTTFAEAFRNHSSLVILGDPGAGKTTLLRWLAVVGAGGPLAMHAALGTTAPPLPLLISVGHLAQVRATLGADTSVVEALAHLFHSRGISSDEASLRGFLERRLEQGDCLVLLDGLDEVRSEARADLMRWLEDFAARYPQNRFIASARQVGYVGLALPDSVEVELGAFEDEQVRRYVRSFHRAYRQWEEGRPDDLTADRESERLLTALFANQRLHELSRNPFVLASLALIHRAEGQLPRHRVQAYEIFARTLCETWGQARRLIAAGGEESQIRYEEEAVPVLGRLALEMHRQWPNGVAPEDFVIETLATALQERDGISREEAERSAREFLQRAGKDVQILMERGPGRWGFLHLTFQEFFAAVGLHASESFEKVGLAHLFDARWEEVLRLGVGYMALVQKRPEATRRFIQQVLERQESGLRQVLTQTLGAHIRAAALFAAEAGDALPSSMQDKIAQAFCEWLCAMPPVIGQPALGDLHLSDFASRLSPCLERLAHDGPPRIRANAIRYLGMLNPDRAPQLIAMTRSDTAPELRSTAAALLAGRPSSEAIHELQALLLDENPTVQNEAAGGIMIAHPEHYATAAKILLGRGSTREFPIEMLVYAWAGSDQRAQMLREWESSSNPSLTAIAELFQDQPNEVPSRPSAVPPQDVYLQMLEAPSEAVRIVAIHALGSTNNLDAIAPLTRLTQSSITEEAHAAMNSIWRIANAAALHALPPEPPN